MFVARTLCRPHLSPSVLRRFLSADSWKRSAASAAVTEAQDQSETSLDDSELKRLQSMRNIGISAHIDSGKTTLTERILFYTGRISEIHDVRGKDGVGALMDGMDLEREKGITIQSAATFTQWKDHNINIIDTPGHVDFTIEVERALRVLDGAVLVLCSVGGVQSQTCTVDRQMKRYNVPRISFINKMDRTGANPWRVIDQMRKKLKIGVAATQIPIGEEDKFEGVVDLISMRAIYNHGDKGEIVKYDDVPESLKELASAKRSELIEVLSDHDDEMADLFLNEIDPTPEQLKAAVRRATLKLNFTPVFMGSAYKNKAVQAALDAVLEYLPNPSEKENKGLDLDNKEAPVILSPDSSEPLVALAFKLEDTKYGQLTYVRVYQGSLKKGMVLHNMRATAKRSSKLAKLVRMHSNEMEEVDELPAGEIGALFGMECASGDSFTCGHSNIALTSMFVPDPVVSLAIRPKAKDSTTFSKALQKFMKEDPTFRVHLDPESRETIISGMGELHLDIYVERMKREYNCECITGKPQVAYRETITEGVKFSYTHKKQSGGAGQYGKIIGSIEPIKVEVDEDDDEEAATPVSPFVMENEFIDRTVGLNVPSQYVPSVEKGFHDACEKGKLIGAKVVGARLILDDGQAHAVDSSDFAFRLAAQGAFREAYTKCNPIILEPIMSVTISGPAECQTNILSQVNKRKGVINESDVSDGYVTVHADISLSKMFGYVSDLRAATQGKGEFTMEYRHHLPVFRGEQDELIAAAKKTQESKRK